MPKLSKIATNVAELLSRHKIGRDNMTILKCDMPLNAINSERACMAQFKAIKCNDALVANAN